MNWIKARLAEHSTQVALGAILASAAAGVQGTMSWQNVATVSLGAVLTAIIPAAAPPPK